MSAVRAGITRRTLLRGRAGSVPPMRPPWAQPESQFLDRCTACGECVARCPEKILTHAADGMPIVAARAGECSYCRECVNVCATAALGREGAAWPDWTAVIGTDCLTNSAVLCQNCRDSCPHTAIGFSAASVPQPQVDPDRCTACGSCSAVCPTNAIDLRQVKAPAQRSHY